MLDAADTKDFDFLAAVGFFADEADDDGGGEVKVSDTPNFL